MNNIPNTSGFNPQIKRRESQSLQESHQELNIDPNDVIAALDEIKIGDKVSSDNPNEPVTSNNNVKPGAKDLDVKNVMITKEDGKEFDQDKSYSLNDVFAMVNSNESYVKEDSWIYINGQTNVIQIEKLEEYQSYKESLENSTEPQEDMSNKRNLNIEDNVSSNNPNEPVTSNNNNNVKPGAKDLDVENVMITKEDGKEFDQNKSYSLNDVFAMVNNDESYVNEDSWIYINGQTNQGQTNQGQTSMIQIKNLEEYQSYKESLLLSSQSSR